MSETAFIQLGTSLPKSSDFNKNVWVGADPAKLIQEGYAEAVDSFPKQAQSTIEVETKFKDMNDSDVMNPTGMASHDGPFLKLRTPDLRPENRNWVTMHPLQEWEGYVLRRGKDDFAARLTDLTAESLASEPWEGIEEEATIPLSEISDDDLERLYPGSVFRWVIGYERAASGTKRRISQIVFRNLPSLTEEDRTEGVEWANRVVQTLGG